MSRKTARNRDRVVDEDHIKRAHTNHNRRLKRGFFNRWDERSHEKRSKKEKL